MLVVTAKVLDAGRELAKANDSLGSLRGRQLCVAKGTYSVTDNIRITPTMAALQPAHDFPGVIIESGVDYLVHVYKSNRVYRTIG
ncbi:MAG: hypothetical protein WD078_16520 [Woeseia sp.]